MDAHQEKNLLGALAEWPEKTGVRWSDCPLGVLAQRWGMHMPTGMYAAIFKRPKDLSEFIEREYGLTFEIRGRLMNSSMAFFRGGRFKSREQKAMLQEFLRPFTPATDLV